MTPPHPSWCVGMGNVSDQVEGENKGPEEVETQQTEKPKKGKGEHRSVCGDRSLHPDFEGVPD